MKRILAALAMVLVLVLAMGTFTACGQPNPPAGDTVTVSWYQGGKLLKEEEVAKGSKVSSWNPPAVEGKDFTGWYAEASLSVAFDFETEINEDTDIFAKYTSNVHVADDKEYYLVGTGSGDMKASAWNVSEPPASMYLTKTENASANVYEITILMYAGDGFQICYGGTWDGQVGIGYMPGVEYAAGTNRYDGGTYEAADKKYATVKNAQGEVVFEGHDEFNKEYWTWNIFLAEGQDGIYKITYTTFPDHPADNQITWELVEKKEPLAVTHEMYICGSINGWDFAEEHMLTPDETKENYSILLSITDEAGAEIKLRNKIADAWYGVAEGETTLGTGTNNLVLAQGVYKIVYNVTEDKATVEEVAKSFWLAGVLKGEGHWNCKSGIEFEKVNETTYKAYYTFTEADTDATWMTGFVGACKAVYGFGGWDAELWFGNVENGDNVTVESYGLYELVLTLNDAADYSAGGSLTATKLEGYYLVGTIGDGDTWRAESQNAIEVVEGVVSTTYTWTEKDNADWLYGEQIAAIKIILVDEAGNVTWYGSGADNVMITEVGTYTITLEGEVVSAVKQ